MRSDPIVVVEAVRGLRILSTIPLDSATFLSRDLLPHDEESFSEAREVFEILCRGTTDLARLEDRDALIHAAADLARQVTGADAAWLALLDAGQGVLRLAGGSPDTAAPHRSIDERIHQQTMDNGLGVLAIGADDADGGSECPASAIYVPLRNSEGAVGLLHVARSRPDKRLTEDDLNRLCVLGEHVTTALGNLSLQEALRESEAKYRTFFEDSLEAMSLTRKGLIVDVNPAWLELHGFADKSKVLGTDIVNVVHPDDRDTFLGRRKTWAGDKRRTFEFRDVRTDDTLIDVEIYSNTIVLHGEEAILTTVHDVTARKRAKDALRESEEKYRTLFEDSLEAMSLTKGGKIVDVNPAWLELHGFADKRQVLGTDIINVVHSEDRELFLQRRKTWSGDARRAYELRDVRKDGAFIDVELYSNTILLDGEEAIVTTVRDITERRRAKDALRESEEKYRTLFEDSLEAMSLTKGGKIVDVNPAWLGLHGFKSKSEVYGLEIMSIIHPDDHHILARRRKMPAKDRVRVYQLRDLRADGSVIDVEVYSSAIMLGGALAILSTVHDITERRHMQQELMQSAKMAALGTMISGVAHELNNPLGAICAYAYLLEEDKSVSAASREEVRNILSEVERCSHIVENLLRFARRDPGKKDMVNVNEVMANSIDLRRYDMQVNNIEIAEEYDPHLPTIYGNAHSLQQVFLNIINNAYDAITEGRGHGRITLRTRWEGDHITIEIEDNGKGIEEPDRIFEPFYTTKDVGKGTGLGLSVGYGIIRNHRGTIVASNTQEGACFTIRLPLTAAGAEPAKERVEEVEIPPTPGKRILVIDDEQKVAKAVRGLLRNMGYVVDISHSPGAALEKLKSSPFDVVVSDLIMPGEMSARDVYNWIQEHRPDLAERVIFLTGSATGTRTRDLLSGLENPVIFKPFRREELCNAVNKAAAP